jgi:hypothetical protein
MFVRSAGSAVVSGVDDRPEHEAALQFDQPRGERAQIPVARPGVDHRAGPHGDGRPDDVAHELGRFGHVEPGRAGGAARTLRPGDAGGPDPPGCALLALSALGSGDARRTILALGARQTLTTSTPCFPGCRGTMTVDDSSEPGTTSSRRRQQNPWKGAGSASKINAEPRSSAGRREGDAVGVTEVFRGEERAEHDAATARRRAQRTVPRTGRPRDRAAARRRAAALPHPRGHPGPERARLRRRHGPLPRRRRPGRGHRRAGREALPAGGSSCRYVSWPAPPTACC